MCKTIALSEPVFRGNEWDYVKECLDNGWVSSVGKYVELFEERICEYAGSKYAVACMNGTSALHVALRVVGVGIGDEVIVPALTFIAPVNAIRYLGADPIFMDCNDYYNIETNKTIDFLEEETEFIDGFTYNKRTKRKISAVVPVHVFGNAVNFHDLATVCHECNIKIVEDASESLGTFYTKGEYRNKHTGTIGDIGCYSFNGNKIITSGGGGMIVTGSKEYAERARYLTTQAKEDNIDYVHNEVGYNYRMTNIQAAIGVAQLEQLAEYILIKKENYQKYASVIDEIAGLHCARPPEYAESNYWFYCVQVDKGIYGKSVRELLDYFAEKSIESRPVWRLNNEQKPYVDCQTYQIERAYLLQKNTVHIPCSVGLNEAERTAVIDVLSG